MSQFLIIFYYINRITCLGAAGLDAVATVAEFPKADDKIRTTSILFGGGGNAANTCTAVSRLGFDAMLISKVGSDTNGLFNHINNNFLG